LIDNWIDDVPADVRIGREAEQYLERIRLNNDPDDDIERFIES
jgi:hypothetical protein